uniref:Uncharacterized protein n=1 Tax=Romanomermis culicivorax TaxID=13658 RepID=A0A915JWZ3_ROMCU
MVRGKATSTFVRHLATPTSYCKYCKTGFLYQFTHDASRCVSIMNLSNCSLALLAFVLTDGVCFSIFGAEITVAFLIISWAAIINSRSLPSSSSSSRPSAPSAQPPTLTVETPLTSNLGTINGFLVVGESSLVSERSSAIVPDSSSSMVGEWLLSWTVGSSSKMFDDESVSSPHFSPELDKLELETPLELQYSATVPYSEIFTMVQYQGTKPDHH